MVKDISLADTARQLIVRDPKSGEDRPKDAFAGDVVVCPNGHVVADITRDLKWGGEINTWYTALKFRGHQIEPGTPRESCVCSDCGAIWFYPEVD